MHIYNIEKKNFFYFFFFLSLSSCKHGIQHFLNKLRAYSLFKKIYSLMHIVVVDLYLRKREKENARSLIAHYAVLRAAFYAICECIYTVYTHLRIIKI